MNARDVPMNAPATMTLPEALRDDVAGYEFAATSLGEAAETYRLTARGRPTRYLKIAKQLEREHARLQWATGRLPAPRVLGFARHAGRAYLLLDELPGTPIELATEHAVAERVAHLANTMRSLHGSPVTGCPFSMRIRDRLLDAETNVRAGEVDESDFDPDRTGRSAASILDELRAWPPFQEDLVLTHGDFTPANILIQPTGLLDLGRLGVADRYQDIALALRYIEGEFGPAWRAPFARTYGIADIDESKLAFFRLLDELF
jgi:aminoglycoside phosphotransferase